MGSTPRRRRTVKSRKSQEAVEVERAALAALACRERWRDCFESPSCLTRNAVFTLIPWIADPVHLDRNGLFPTREPHHASLPSAEAHHTVVPATAEAAVESSLVVWQPGRTISDADRRTRRATLAEQKRVPAHANPRHRSTTLGPFHPE